MTHRAIRTRSRLVVAAVLALGLPTGATAAAAPASAAPRPVVAAPAAVRAAEAQAPSMLGRWHYVSGPNGALDPGQDWLIDVTQAADGTLVGTIVTSSHTSGPCVVGGIQWRAITPLGVGRWTGEQSACDGTFLPTEFSASETGRLYQRTSGTVGWWLEPVALS